MKYIYIFTVLIIMGFAAFLYLQLDHSVNPSEHSDHNGHSDGINSMLTEAGNDAFGTIQEVITLLESDPQTDWKKVNMEALRQHLVDMEDMTKNISVENRIDIEGGFSATVIPTSIRAFEALERTMTAHPSQMKAETGWEMNVEKVDGKFNITVTTENPDETDKLRGLGYIGIMAYGNHHQPHHFAMASGVNPHEMH